MSRRGHRRQIVWRNAWAYFSAVMLACCCSVVLLPATSLRAQASEKAKPLRRSTRPGPLPTQCCIVRQGQPISATRHFTPACSAGCATIASFCRPITTQFPLAIPSSITCMATAIATRWRITIMAKTRCRRFAASSRRMR